MFALRAASSILSISSNWSQKLTGLPDAGMARILRRRAREVYELHAAPPMVLHSSHRRSGNGAA